MGKWNPEIKMELEHRDISIFKIALSDLIKKLERLERHERRLSMETRPYLELLEYCEHLQRRVGACLDNEVLVTSDLVKNEN